MVMYFEFTFTWLFVIILHSAVFRVPACNAASQQQTTTVDVLILGGGLAGISAANLLHNNGITNFLVLEAQDVEEGSKNPILQLANKLNLSAYLNNQSDIAVKNSPGGRAAFSKALKDLIAAEDKVIEDNEQMPHREDQPMHSALAVKGWIADTPLKSAVQWQRFEFELALRTEMISTRHFTGFWEENKIITDPRGYPLIFDYLSMNFTDKIKNKTVATEIKYGFGTVEVKTKDGHTYKAKYALCTFSTGVLASDLVKFVPELPQWKKEAIRMLPLVYYTNTFVKFPNAFWDDNEFIIEAGKSRGTFPMLYNLNKKGMHPGSNILLFTAIEDNSFRVERQSKNATIEEVLKVLKEMYPDVDVPYPTDIVVGQFGRNPYVRGAYSNAAVGSTTADFHNLEGRLDNLFFAGEACHEKYWGYLQGAYFTGQRQAQAIVNCINDKECPLYEPEKSGDGCPTNTADHHEKGTGRYACFLGTVVHTANDCFCMT